ncbi:TPA: oligosaccharide flippase family protein [Vibrio vulnificus]|nr:oligosaccharide flippase family protein [Vibrio vulnificus]HDY8136887.1 oligosaccharide flippase family protein [Vibrio vulnificus]HDY8150410.1 oligosaccharide flippase family protein [Vibrio vulnificus]HDY8153859.1 oligosaccharide flippase family protein [Vibrio vulnificus]
MRGRIAKNTVLYILFDIITKIIPFILIPIVTSYLTVEEYGKVSLFQTLIEISTILVVCGGHQRYRFLFFNQEKESSIIFIKPIIVSLFLSIIIFLIYIGGYLFGEIEILMLLAPVVAFFQSIISLYICRFQNEENPKKIGMISVTLSGVGLILTILFFKLGFGLEGRYLSIALAPTAIGLLLILQFSSNVERKVFSSAFTDLANFIKHSVQYLPTSLSWWLRNGMDRIIINILLGTASVGIFSLLTQLSMILTVFGMAMNNAFMPNIFKLIRRKHYRDTIKLLSTFCVIIFFVTLILILTLPVLIKMLLPEEYWLAIDYISIALFSTSLYIIYVALTNLLVASDLSGKLSVLSIISAFFHVFLSWILVKEYYILGVFYSAIISYCFSISLLIILWKFCMKNNSDTNLM